MREAPGPTRRTARRIFAESQEAFQTWIVGRIPYTGLPRGRVTRPDKTYLILHGEDSPDFPAGWEKLVIEAFGLSGRNVKSVFDEHETQIPGHPQAVEASVGHGLFTDRG
jgi:hypothetical protein